MPVFIDFSLLWQWYSTYQNLKGWPSQKCEFQSSIFQKVPIWQQPLANQLGGFEYNFRCLKRFFRKVRRKLRSAFSLKLRFLKTRLLVTWLKCLYLTPSSSVSFVGFEQENVSWVKICTILFCTRKIYEKI